MSSAGSLPILLGVVLLACSPMVTSAQESSITEQAAPAPLFTLQEVMIPVRDGVRLQTAILRPIDQSGPLPILFQRTPYGVPDKPYAKMPSYLKELMQDGYILVVQNLRGRFKSEGEFKLSSWDDLNDPKATNETTDAYDSIVRRYRGLGEVVERAVSAAEPRATQGSNAADDARRDRDRESSRA